MSTTLFSLRPLSGLMAAVCLCLSMAALAAPRSERFKPVYRYMDCSATRASASVTRAAKPVVAAPLAVQMPVALPCSRKPAR